VWDRKSKSLDQHCRWLDLEVLLLLLHPFNGLFSRITWVSWYQKGKTSLDLNGTRGDGVLVWQWHQLDNVKGKKPVWTYIRQEMMRFWDAAASAGPYVNNLHLASDRYPHRHFIPQFLQAGCSS